METLALLCEQLLLNFQFKANMAADGNCNWKRFCQTFSGSTTSSGDGGARTSGLKLEFAAHKELHMYKQTSDKQPENHQKSAEV